MFSETLKVFAKLYQRLERASRKIGLSVKETYTPYEFSNALIERMEEIAETQIVGRYLESAPRELKWMVEQTILAAYSPKPPDLISRFSAIKTWEVLRWQFALAALIVMFFSLKNRLYTTLHRIFRKERILQGEFNEG